MCLSVFAQARVWGAKGYNNLERQVSFMASLDKEVRKIIMAGIGAISDTVEKSKDAIENFVQSEGVRNMAEKGEVVFHSAVDVGKKAVDRVKKTFTEDEIKEKVRQEKERLTRLAREIRQLNPAERDILDRLVKDGEEAFYTGEEGIGKPGVHDSPHDYEVDPNTYRPKAEVPYKESQDHPHRPTPTAPDDEINTNKVKSNNMNDHIPQNVPPRY
jgi:polyhydroxyalkanoate synthesis regulator phasin